MLVTLQQDDVDVQRRSRARNAPKFDAHANFFGMCGVNLTHIDGIDTATALKVIAVVSPNMSRFESTKRFSWWL